MNSKKSMASVVLLVMSSLLLSTGPAFAGWEALPDVAPAPKNNPTTDAKVTLGKMLYMDPRISSTGTVSCNSCHNLMEGGDDSRPVSMGVDGKKGGRSAPTVWNAAFNSVQFWDGRVNLLEDQAIDPITNPVEMGEPDYDHTMAKIKSIPGYRPYFEKAFGRNSMNIDNLAKAIAAFERTLITPNSAYDKYVKGDKTAMNAQQIRGMNTFAATGCNSCHSGAAFNGPKMPFGQGFYAKFPTFMDNVYSKKYNLTADKGREASTDKVADAHMFRVPTLRNITDTAPYFHNGSVNDLSEAVRLMAKTQLNKDLPGNEVKDIVSFLSALTGPYPEITMPRLPATPGHSVVAK